MVFCAVLVVWGLGRGLRWWFPARYTPLVAAAAARNGVDPRLVWAVIRTESRFRPDAVSPVGAVGLMQITPSTGRWIASQLGSGRYERSLLFDPAFNVQAGTWYLAYLLRSFGGRLPLALAAYNAGSDPVRSWVAAGLWSGGTSDLDRIPYPETRQFVYRVLRTYAVYRRLYSRIGS